MLGPEQLQWSFPNVLAICLAELPLSPEFQLPHLGDRVTKVLVVVVVVVVGGAGEEMIQWIKQLAMQV